MSWRMGLIRLLDVILRIPPIFALDYLINGSALSILVAYSELRGTSLLVVYATFAVCAITAIIGLFSLSTDHLFVVYSFLLAGGILCLSYKFTSSFITNQKKSESSDTDSESWLLPSSACWNLVICNVLIQCMLAFCFNHLLVDIRLDPNAHVCISQWSAYFIFILPIALCRVVRSMPEPILRKFAVFAVSVAGMDLQVVLVTRFGDIARTVGRHLIRARAELEVYGLQFFVQTQWRRLHVPNVLRMFWLSRTVYHFATHLITGVVNNELMSIQSAGSQVVSADIFMSSLFAALTQSCENWLLIMGMASVVSRVSRLVDSLLVMFSGATDVGAAHSERDVGTLSAVLFVILAFQTSLSSTEDPVRMLRLFRNLCLVMVAVLHSEHAIVHGHLMSLAAAQNFDVVRHVRALVLAVFLAITPAIFVCWLWTKEDRADTWLLALTALSAEIIVKVVVSVLTYTLFIVDSLRSTFWIKFDDYVYLVQSVGSTVEFLIGVFLFGNGAWKFVFESGGTIRAVMMCLHAYFNIWVQAKEGWQTFVRRQTAAKKVDQLRSATASEIAARDDVCAICYNAFNGCACVTNCGHLFHGVCLRKWLYIKDVCPMCHQTVSAGSASDSSPGNAGT